MTGGYGAHDTARRTPEPPKRARTSGRGPFERDRARVLHSAALRRLAAKTQVVEVGSADGFPRTRLTHSLECVQVGRELGASVGCDPDLVDAACLAHDLGHPPFGHNGEAALNDLAAPCGGFEGNAQSLRLLTRLEAKVAGAGLNLTRAALDATLKYPWLGGGAGAGAAGDGAAGDGRAGAADGGPAKYGAYQADADVFGWVREGAPPGVACLEAQVMDWADDVAYSVHDLEDGLQAGMITLAALRDPAERQVVAELTAAMYVEPSGSVSAAELAEVLGALLGLPCWPASFDGGPAGLAGLKNLTSELIGRFCEAATDATIAKAGYPVTRYAAGLEVPRAQRLECALLKGVTAHYVMHRAGVAEAQARQRELITELAAAVLDGAPGTLEPVLQPAWHAAAGDAERLRVVVDQIASLTDTSAIARHGLLYRSRRV